MSVSAISSGNPFASYSPIAGQNKFQQIQQELLQLGQDLRSGNLSQAQTDFSALQQLFPGQPQNLAAGTIAGNTASTPSGSTANPVSESIAQLGQDLSAGNVSAASSDLATLQQNLQQQGAVSTHRFHHHRLSGNPIFENQNSQQNSPATLFGQLGQNIAAGNLTAAQQTYSALQQDFLQFIGGGSGLISAGSTSATNASLSVSVLGRRASGTPLGARAQTSVNDRELRIPRG